MATGHFGPGLYAFFEDLKAHNDRGWFAEHRARYRAEVEEPMRQFIRDLAPRLARISPRLKVDPRPVGGSMFRIQRDTRFSPDKSPFKTAVAARFTHDARGRDAHGRPGFYIHLSPDRSVGGGGLFRPETASLRRIREAIAGDGRRWTRAVSGLDLEGDSLKRVPAGYPADHPRALDLRRKDHYVMDHYTAAEVTSPGFLDRYVATCERAAPLVEFLVKALGLRW